VNERIQFQPPNPPQVPAPEAAEDEIDLRELFAILLDAKWLILGIAAAVLFVAVLYAVLATPIYRANVLIQVNEDNAAFQTGAMSELAASLNGQVPPADTEIAIMRSRYVVGSTVDKLGLAIDAEPDYLPLIGPFVARHYDGVQPASPFLGFSSHAWGGEQIKVTRLNVPRDWLDKPLRLVAGAGGSYTLYGPEGNKLLNGQVGRAAYLNASAFGRGAHSFPGKGERARAGKIFISSLSPSGRGQGEGTKKRAKAGGGSQISLFVSQLAARPGTRFQITKHPRLEAINNLQQELFISETGKGTNIVKMSLESPHPQQAVRTLDTIAATYVKQNVQNNAEQAHESLKFFKGLLSKLKAKLDAAQVQLSQYQAKHQALDISADTKSLLDQMVDVEKQLSELKLKATEMSGRFNAGFPALQSVHAQINKMQQIKGKLKDRIKDVPKAQQEIFRLKRDVEVDNTLYMALLAQAQQLRVTQAGTVGNARIVDHAALPIKPVKPRKALIAGLGLVLGLMFGAFTAFVRKAFNHGIDDPDLVEQEFGLPVYAIVPHSDELIKQQRAAERRNDSIPILAKAAPNALAVEALRSLRTGLQFALMDARNNVVAISGPAPSIGKSFISVNLAHLLADAGKRVLLIDADMRKGHLHQYFGAAREPGLSQVLSGELAADAAIYRGEAGMDVLFSGTLPPNPSELLMRPAFSELIDGVSKQYDLVLIDAPPILAVTDGALIAKQAGANLAVLRAGQHAAREIKLMLRRFEQNGAVPQGVIFNDVTKKASSYSYSKYGYQYQYEYK
jgi:tyrosine-protein kinase Etk/Wzc